MKRQQRSVDAATAFRRAMCALPERTAGESLTDANQRLRAALLRYGSETDDNKSCARRISYGRPSSAGSGKFRPLRTMKVVSTNAQLADITNLLEGEEIHPAVRRHFPTLTQEEWDATFRFLTLVLLSLERSRTS
jgi:hypothetical protein